MTGLISRVLIFLLSIYNISGNFTLDSATALLPRGTMKFGTQIVELFFVCYNSVCRKDGAGINTCLLDGLSRKNRTAKYIIPSQDKIPAKSTQKIQSLEFLPMVPDCQLGIEIMNPAELVFFPLPSSVMLPRRTCRTDSYADDGADEQVDHDFLPFQVIRITAHTTRPIMTSANGMLPMVLTGLILSSSPACLWSDRAQ